MTPLRFALLGDPVDHSKSPAMHMSAFAAMGLPHTYDAIRAERGELAEYVRRLKGGAFAGLNITLPHKHAILKHVDDVDPVAKIAGAANTLFRRGSRVVATTTDVAAIAAEVRTLSPNPIRNALVIGAGGAARSAIVALARELGAEQIVVRGRTRTAELAKEIQPNVAKTKIVGEPLMASDRDGAFDCIVQASSAGMTGIGSGDVVAKSVAWEHVAKGAVVLDVVYDPVETPFLAAAKARGLRHTGGLGILARQGALSLEVWLEQPAPFEVMLAAIR